MIGRKFGRWTVVKRAENRGYRKVYECRCECGTIKEVYLQNLTGNKSQSCGCLPKDIVWTGHGQISGAYWSRLRADAIRRQKQFSVDIKFAWKLFEKQRSSCALSGMPIKFAESAKGLQSGENTASMDRIDSSKGYVPGNVQWVHKDINKMKQDLAEDRFVYLCREVVQHAS